MKNFRNKKISNTKSWQKGRKKPLRIKLPKIISKRNALAAFAWLVLARNSNRKDMQKSSQKRKGRKKKLLILAGFLVIFLTVYELLFSDYLAINNFGISGNQSINSDKVMGLVRSDLSKKIYNRIPENNFFITNTKHIENLLKSNFNEIESVEVKKTFPDKLSILIKEKNPALIWCRQNCYFVNDQGIAFMPVSDTDAADPNKHYIKIIEQAVIPEETSEEKAAVGENSSAANTVTPPNTSNASTSATIVATGTQNNISTNPQDQQTLSANSVPVDLMPININDQVSDDSFIKFTIDINNRLSYNSKLKIVYYKTKGTKTRELIAFTDKNTRLYFDTTKSAEKQANNLDYFLGKGIDPSKIDSLQYIYMKNEDRIFYK